MKLTDFTRLRKLMGLTVSDNDHEALQALRSANAILKQNDITWDKFFSRTVTVVNDFDAAPDDEPNSEGKRRAKMVDQAFEVLARKELRGDAEDFIASLQEQWANNGYLSEKQQEALFKFARNAEEGR